jgi:hypothetical protein
MVHLVSSSTASAFVTNMSEKQTFTSPRATQVKNQEKAIFIEDGKRIVHSHML